jgi:hypothetical protein
VSWPLLILVFGVTDAALALAVLRLVSGEWPDLIVPGSHAGAHEADWYRVDRTPLRVRLRSAVERLSRPSVRADTPSSGFANEIAWRAARLQPARLQPTRIPHPFEG